MPAGWAHRGASAAARDEADTSAAVDVMLDINLVQVPEASFGGLQILGLPDVSDHKAVRSMQRELVAGSVSWRNAV